MSNLLSNSLPLFAFQVAIKIIDKNRARKDRYVSQKHASRGKTVANDPSSAYCPTVGNRRNLAMLLSCFSSLPMEAISWITFVNVRN